MHLETCFLNKKINKYILKKPNTHTLFDGTVIHIKVPGVEFSGEKKKNVWPVLNTIRHSKMVAVHETSRTAFNVHRHVHLLPHCRVHVPADWDAIKTQLELAPG